MASLVLAKLTTRKIIKIYGPDCYPYLQGLISNDLRYLYEPDRIPKTEHAKSSPNVLSTFMLNAQGRAICDMLIYRTPSTRLECQFEPPNKLKEKDELFIECDDKLASGLANTLYGYRVRRKIALIMMDNHTIWSLFPKFEPNQSGLSVTQDELSLINTIQNSNEIMESQLTVVNDPRLSSMGMRIISYHTDFDKIKSRIQSFLGKEVEEGSLKDYIKHRYRLGVGEGLSDHPESDCLPLECNADLLNSVSFTKGCYLGQELTARIHHTGVVRKRLMPITLELDQDKSLSTIPLVGGTEIIDQGSKKKIGTLRHRVGSRGLALLRHDLLSESSELIHQGSSTKVFTYRPYWWESNGQIS